MLDDGHAYAFAPDVELFDGGGTEGVGGSEVDFFAGLLEVVGELAYRGGLADAVDADYHDDVGLAVGFEVESGCFFCIVL